MALNSQGSYFRHADNSSPNQYATLEECKTINGPDGQAQQIDTTHLLSTGKEYLPSLADYGNVSLECNGTFGAVQMALKAMYDNSSDPEQFEIHIPTTSAKTQFHVFHFLGIVTKWQLSEGVNAEVKLSITVKVSGAFGYSGIV